VSTEPLHGAADATRTYGARAHAAPSAQPRSEREPPHPALPAWIPREPTARVRALSPTRASGGEGATPTVCDEPPTRETSPGELASLLVEVARSRAGLPAGAMELPRASALDDEPPTTVYARRATAGAREGGTARGWGPMRAASVLRLATGDRMARPSSGGARVPRAGVARRRDRARTRAIWLGVAPWLLLGALASTALCTLLVPHEGTSGPRGPRVPPPLPTLAAPPIRASVTPLPSQPRSHSSPQWEVPDAPALLRRWPEPNAAPRARRAAVDLLVAGRTRAALDAYRDLAQRDPTPALLAVVRLLEQALLLCMERGDASCG